MFFPEDARRDERVFRQVVLVRGGTRLTTWVEASFAVEGKPVRLYRDGEWEDGWTVETAYSMERTGDEIQQQRETRQRWADRKGPRKRYHPKIPVIEGWS